ncbi:MAG: cell division protein ZapA [bacterium]|nr:cell division protein ZapA [bacterium]
MSDESKSSSVVAVRIAGHEYKIRSDGDPDGLKEIAGYVDRAMARVRERTGTVDTFDVAVLTCLNLAREILALREARTPEGSTAIEDDKLRSLIENVEAALLVQPMTDAVEETAPATAERGATTLELPSFESLRERDDGEAAAADLEAPRVAAGGRDRAS